MYVFFDEDGYYIYNIYPYMLVMGHSNENGEVQIVRFGDEDGFIYSKNEFDYVLENEVIPFLDDLLDRGLIMQEFYDEFIRDPLDKAVEQYFGAADEQ